MKLKLSRSSYLEAFLRWVLAEERLAWRPTSDTDFLDDHLAEFLQATGIKRGVRIDETIAGLIQEKYSFDEDDLDFVELLTHLARLVYGVLGDRWHGDALLARTILVLAVAYGFEDLSEQILVGGMEAALTKSCKALAKQLDVVRDRHKDVLFRVTLRAAFDAMRTLLVGRVAAKVREVDEPTLGTLLALYYEDLKGMKALFHGLIAMAWADGELASQERRYIKDLVKLMEFEDMDEDELLASLDEPVALERWAGEVTDTTTRRFLLEQLALVSLIDGTSSPGEEAFLGTLAAEFGYEAHKVEQIQREAAVFYELNADALDSSWLGGLDRIRQRFFGSLGEAIRDNLGKIISEIKETGELSKLLASATTRSLSVEEKAKVKAQLLDICKTIPALGLFALPGGSVLLPILIKALPFNILPSEFAD